MSDNFLVQKKKNEDTIDKQRQETENEIVEIVMSELNCNRTRAYLLLEGNNWNLAKCIKK